MRPVPPRGDYARRFAGFAIVPLISAISPLAVLPIVAREAGQAGWASAITGEAIGTFAAIFIGWGWPSIGAAQVAVRTPGDARGRLYRESLAVRTVMSAVALPVMAIVCVVVATPGFMGLTLLMGLQGGLIAMSFVWFAVGEGDPRSIVLFDAVPRVLSAVTAAVLISLTGMLELYPLAGIAVTVIGTCAYTASVLKRHPAPWPKRDAYWRLIKANGDITVNDAALGAYSAVPVPLVTVTGSPGDAAGYASADKLVKLGQFVPLTIANALQSWTAEHRGPKMVDRVRFSFALHAAIGLMGWALVSVLGPAISDLAFGSAARGDRSIFVILGLAFALFSIRTSFTRHALFPAGKSQLVMRAGVAGTVAGLPAVVLGVRLMGETGAACGFALAECVMIAVLAQPAFRACASFSTFPELIQQEALLTLDHENGSSATDGGST